MAMGRVMRPSIWEVSIVFYEVRSRGGWDDGLGDAGEGVRARDV